MTCTNLFRTTLLLVLLSVHVSVRAQKIPAPAFTISEKDLIPECIAYDSLTGNFYAGSLYKNKIVRMDKKGNVSPFITSGRDSLGAVVGIKIDPNTRTLWACSNGVDTSKVNSAVFEYQLPSGKLVRKYSLPDVGHFLNDLYCCKNGDVYITDTKSGAIYLIHSGGDRIETFLPPGTFYAPNGICANASEESLFIATGNEKGIVLVNRASKQFEGVECRYLLVGLDGMYRYGNKLIGVENTTFPEFIQQITLSADDKHVTDVNYLVAPSSKFVIPTTGVVIGSKLYYILNSGLDHLDFNTGQLMHPETMIPTQIYQVSLD